MQRRRLIAVIALVGASILAGRPAAASSTLGELRERHGAAWSLEADPSTGRPRRLAGGAIRWMDASSFGTADAATVDRLLVAKARAFLHENGSLLGLDPASLREASAGAVSTDGGRLRVIAFDVAPSGVRVVGGRVTLAVSSGSLVYVHAVGTEPVLADPRPAVAADEALAVTLRSASLIADDLARVPEPELVFLREGAGHRLAWQATLIEREAPRRRLARVDARSGEILSLTDETLSSCASPVPGTTGRVLGGVRPRRADEPERQEMFPLVEIGGTTSGEDGLFSGAAPPFGAALTGPAATVACVACVNPATPFAPAGPGPDADFGLGGADATGNGASTPADRTAYFHVLGARRLASRWLALPFLQAPIVVRTNVADDCNAFYDGRALSFFRSSDACANTGEIRDIVAHEWGHALDDHDGLPASEAAVDAATGEAAADIVAMLRSRDACIGESFFLDAADFPTAGCSGVRDLDENAPSRARGGPAALTPGNVAAACRASGFYRGPMGREGHCEGEILGQAFWHLVQDLRTGVSGTDGSALPGGALPEDEAWQAAERIFFASRPLLASYAPSSLQSIGVSAYDAFLLADDEGDGLANGTPHAAAIHDAFAHHGIAESATIPPTQPPCAGPAAPVLRVSAGTDDVSGLPVVGLAWDDVGAAGYEVLRADDGGDAMLRIGEVPAGGSPAFADRGVLPGRTYRYAVVGWAPGGCRSGASAAVSALPGSLLRIESLLIDDSAGGNGDGSLAEGETAELIVSVTNGGVAPISGLSLSLDDPAVPIAALVRGPVAFGTLPPGATLRGPTAFRVRVDAGVPRVASLAFSGESDEGCVRAAFAVTVDRRELQLAGTRLVDRGGDGSWEPGEAADLALALYNVGEIDADDVAGTLSFRGAPPPGVTLVSSAATWPSVVARGPAAESIIPGFVVAADASVPEGTRVPLSLQVRVAGALSLGADVDLVVGGFPPGSVLWSLPMDARSTPIVVQLTDDDADGRITGCDVPDVVFYSTVPTGTRIRVVAVSGADGSEIWHFEGEPCIGFDWATTLAGGDIDGDGLNEIVVADSAGYICALSHEGDVQWRAMEADHDVQTRSASIQLWDLEGDGSVEVIADGFVVRGADGSVVWEHREIGDGRVQIGDIDLDGIAEVITGNNGTFRPDGSTCPVNFPCSGGDGGMVNMDRDQYPEVVMTGNTAIYAYEHDGTTRWIVRDGGYWDVEPRALTCFGDFDRDGLAETAFSTNVALTVIDDDGSILWSVPLAPRENAYNSACSVFDFDDDGVPEIVQGDRTSLAIFSGTDGQVLWRSGASGASRYSVPVIADVNNDGAADIVFAMSNQWPAAGMGLFVYSNPRWAPARNTWNQETYSVSHVRDDGGIDSPPFPRWLTGNDWRGQARACGCVGARVEPSAWLANPESSTFCFDAGDVSGVPPVELSWDFGDGSPAATGPAPCHSFAASGDYAVTLTATGGDGCAVQAGLFVHARPMPTIALTIGRSCTAMETCGSVATAGGLAPLEVRWDFGDGLPLASGDTACRELAAGPHDVTVFVRDANGATAETTMRVVTIDRDLVVEVSAPSSEPLRLTKAGAGAITVTWDDPGQPVNVYRGHFEQYANGVLIPLDGYDHSAWPGGCRSLGTATATEPARAAYFLVGTASCDDFGAPGPLGSDTSGSRRPSPGELGLPECR